MRVAGGGAMTGKMLDRRGNLALLAQDGGCDPIGGAVWVYFKLQPPSAADGEGTYRIAIECANPDCDYREVKVTKSRDLDFPLVCPKCGGHSVYKLWVCRNCGHYFRVKPGASDIVCPNCGSHAVGTAEDIPPATTPP